VDCTTHLVQYAQAKATKELANTSCVRFRVCSWLGPQQSHAACVQGRLNHSYYVSLPAGPETSVSEVVDLHVRQTSLQDSILSEALTRRTVLLLNGYKRL
jgi:hypothetical protein